jgi:hypothetical protein
MKVKLQEFREIDDFPSGSGIEYFNEKLYVIGDDAKDIMVLDKKWRKETSIPLFDSAELRIPKKIKADLEASTIIELNKIPRLLVLGSGSTLNRNRAILVNLDDHYKEEMDITGFYNRIKDNLDHVNIESAAVILGKLLLGNRGNLGSPENNIIVTDMDFWKHPEQAEWNKVIFKMPEEFPRDKMLGLSGMTYSHKNDWLICTMSTESTTNAYDDGAIGDSYLAIVENASRKIFRKKMNVNEVINLSEVDEAFKGYKIESATILSEKDGRLKMHLVADNDTGKTYLFRIRLKG